MAAPGTPPKRQKSQEPSQFGMFLKNFGCSSPTFPNDVGKVITIDRSATVAEALKKLIEHRILALPVIEKATNTPVCVVSILDILGHILNKIPEEQLKRLDRHTYDLFALVAEKKEIEHETIQQIREIGLFDPVQAIAADTTLYDAVVRMIEQKAHRLVIFDDKGRFVNLITQSRVLQFAACIMDQIPKTKKTVGELNIGTKEVYSVPDTLMAYKAFKLMVEKKVSGLAVVNHQGVLVGNISSSDIKLIGFDMGFFAMLASTVGDYMQQLKALQNSLPVRSNAVALNDETKSNFVVKCKSTDTLSLVIKMINFYGVHRVYIVDNEGKPTGVISIYDILRTLMEP